MRKPDLSPRMYKRPRQPVLPIDIDVSRRRRMHSNDNVKKPCAKVITDRLNNSRLAKALLTCYLSALASQLLFNLSVISLAQGFFMFSLLYILLLGLRFVWF